MGMTKMRPADLRLPRSFLTSPTIQGTVDAGTGLTMPPFTLGGAVSGDSKAINDLGGLDLNNNVYITARNNADSGDISMIKVNASDLVEFGANLAALTMGGDLTIGSNLLKTTNLMLKEYTSEYWILRDSTDSANKSLLLSRLLFKSYLAGQSNSVSIQTQGVDNAYIAGKARDNTVGFEEIFRMESAAEPRFGHTLPLNLRSSSTLTVSTGAITVGVAAGTAWYVINGEGAAADNLDSINGGATGDIIILMKGDANITLRDAADSAGNIVLGGTGVTFVMDDAEDIACLFYNGSNWCMLSRESNG